MARCWEQRGCDEDMQRECPHNIEYKDNCPTKCAFAACDRPTYQLTTDPDLIFDPSVDRSVTIKDGCMYCEFFLTHAPKIEA